MYDVIPGSEGREIGIAVRGRLTVKDYDSLRATLEKAIAEHGPLRLLCDMTAFKSFELGAFWEDFKFSLRHLKDFERMAIVGDQVWIDWWVKIAAPFFSAEVKLFPPGETAAAWAWLRHSGDG